MDGTIIGQGSFVVPATVVNQYIKIPSGVDWMKVLNYTNAAKVGGATGLGVSYYWQRGMAPGTGVVNYYGNATAVMSGDTLVSGGFTLYDPSGQTAGALPLIGNAVATTASTNAVRPVVSTASTAGIVVGSVVRMSNTAQTDVNGIDMVVGAVTTNVSFTLLTATNPLANVPGVVGGAGFYRIVNTSELFYPRRRVVVNITNAVTPTVSTSIAHGMTPGQEIRFSIPTLVIGNPGMIQLNGLSAIVLSVTDDYNFVINIDTSAFNTFVWPTVAQQPSSFPLMVPFGEDTATSLSTPASQVPTIGGIQINGTQSGILADATVNTGFLGMVLGTGGVGTVAGALAISGPAGTAAADVVYWVAGKSSYGGL
jgi:hypothetical protein